MKKSESALVIKIWPGYYSIQIDRGTVRTNSDLEIWDIEIKNKRMISLPQLTGKHRQYSKEWREQHEKQLEDEKYHEQQDFSLLFLLVSALELPYPWIISVNSNYLMFQSPLNSYAIQLINVFGTSSSLITSNQWFSNVCQTRIPFVAYSLLSNPGVLF